MVSIAAFQAVDPGSIPGRRNILPELSKGQVVVNICGSGRKKCTAVLLCTRSFLFWFPSLPSNKVQIITVTTESSFLK